MGRGGKEKTEPHWRVGVYIRLSREDGNAESDSVVNQKKILREYLAERFEGQYSIADFYIDDGLTGTDDTRVGFMRLIQDVEQGKVNCMLCKTLSRAFRNYSDQGYYLEYYFPQKNLRFISTGDPEIDTYKHPEALTGMEVPITGLMNDRFSAKTSNDIRRTFATKRRAGEFIGAFAPYGYLKDPENKNHLILDEDIVPVKRELYRWLVHEGMSLGGAAKRLNELGIPNPTAYKRSLGWKYSNPHAKENDGLWVGTTIRRMLLEPVNLGHMVQGRQRVVSYKVHDTVSVPEDEWFVVHNTHAPTFSQEEYDTLARLLHRDTRTPNGARHMHLFAALLKCRDCGKAMRRKPSQRLVYYACRTYTEKSQARCTRHSIREDQLEPAVLAAVQLHFALVEQLAPLLPAAPADGQTRRLRALREEKLRALEKTQGLADGLYLDWKAGDITREDFLRMKARFEAQKEQLAAAIEKLGEEARRQEDPGGAQALERLLREGTVRQLERAVLMALLDVIYVHEGKEITLAFRFCDALPELCT